MSCTCDSLVRSRWVPAHETTIEVGCWKRLKEPEPCGHDAMRYKVRRPQSTRYEVPVEGEFNFGTSLVRFAPSPWVETNLCDRHKQKALNEGMEVVAI
jgi:hypothetical protein